MGRPRYWIRRKNILWKKLVKKLNSSKEHLIKDVEKECEYYFNFDMVQDDIKYPYRTYGMYMRNLEKYGFICYKSSINQNGNKTTKVVVKKKIGKKVTPELLDQFRTHPWLSWFMYPE